VPTSGAIANAIFDAVGVRIKSLPMTAEKVLMAIMAKRDGEQKVLPAAE
jgi:CO/xanthine dehydrogenase Mo-binding subunit